MATQTQNPQFQQLTPNSNLPNYSNTGQSNPTIQLPVTSQPSFYNPAQQTQFSPQVQQAPSYLPQQGQYNPGVVGSYNPGIVGQLNPGIAGSYNPGASKISEQVIQSNQPPIKGESRIEYVPYERTVTEWDEVKKQVQVPITKQVTDYYAVQYDIEYIPQVIQEKVIEYMPVERVAERTEYYTVEKQNIMQQPQEQIQQIYQPPQYTYQQPIQQQVTYQQPIIQQQPIQQQFIQRPVQQQVQYIPQPIPQQQIMPVNQTFVQPPQSITRASIYNQPATTTIPQQQVAQTFVQPQGTITNTQSIQPGYAQYGQQTVIPQPIGQQDNRTIQQTGLQQTVRPQGTYQASQQDEQALNKTKQYQPVVQGQAQVKKPIQQKSFLERLFD